MLSKALQMSGLVAHRAGANSRRRRLLASRPGFVAVTTATMRHSRRSETRGADQSEWDAMARPGNRSGTPLRPHEPCAFKRIVIVLSPKVYALAGIEDACMNVEMGSDALEPGYEVPALPGMRIDEVQTPCLILDLDALERNLRKMGEYAKAHNIRLRAHAKMHKSVDVFRLQEKIGGARGVCCQKVSEAEVFARAGITDILISNQVRDAGKIDRLARHPKSGARIIVCVDDLANVAELSEAAVRNETTIECLIEIDCGAGRCGGTTSAAVVEIAEAIAHAKGLKFSGLQAYQGAMQHLPSYDERSKKFE